MTESELHAIMVGGMATIAGSVFGVYVSFGAYNKKEKSVMMHCESGTLLTLVLPRSFFPTGVDPVAILAASIMSAPAALAISKIAYPETEDSPTSTGKKGAYDVPPSGDTNIVHAATNGAVIGTQLMLNIAGNLIAFLAIIEMLDQLLIYLGGRVDISLSFNIVCQYLFWPCAWLMGVDTADCEEVAILIGKKIFANEFVAYAALTSPDVKNAISARSFYIASYALCGFSNFGSIGIMLGGLTPMAPNQGPKLAKLVMSAMIAGNTACLMTACIAGIFYEAEE
jgi:nucleoside transporter